MAGEYTKEELEAQELFKNSWHCSVNICTDPADRPVAERAISDAYALLGKQPPKFIWADSKSHAWRLIKEAAAAGDIEELAPDSNPYTCHYGQADSYWVAFWVFERDIRKKRKISADELKKIDIMERIVRSVNLWFPYEELCICVERPLIVNWDLKQHPRPHSDNKPFAVWRDGTVSCVLNDVRLHKEGFAPTMAEARIPNHEDYSWLAILPEDKIDPALVVGIENAEIRREFVRKVGIERIVAALGAKVLDKQTFTNDTGDHAYELLELKVDGKKRGGRKWRYLRMNNPSLPGIVHLEGVPNSIKTVRAALLFRSGLTEDQIDDVNGADWVQQGDVVLLPDGATKVKLFPKVLT